VDVPSRSLKVATRVQFPLGLPNLSCPRLGGHAYDSPPGRDSARSAGEPDTNSVTQVRLLLVAYPGAGKGTQAPKLAAHYGITHLSSGALFRTEISNGTEIGKVAVDYLNRGDLVPDELVFDMLSKPILEAVGQGGYVLDGFPRTLGQAEAAYSVAKEIKDIELQAVVYLRVGHDELLNRLRARAGREKRTDDGETTIVHRFNVFETETEPLLSFYQQRGILLEINGEQSVEDVFGDITSAVDALHI
jgi:adenylate kinase